MWQYDPSHRLKYKMPSVPLRASFYLVAWLSPRSWLFSLQLLHLPVSQLGRERKHWNDPSLPTRNTSWKPHDFHSHPIGWRLVAWPHLALREGRKCSLYSWHLLTRPADIWMFYFWEGRGVSWDEFPRKQTLRQSSACRVFIKQCSVDQKWWMGGQRPSDSLSRPLPVALELIFLYWSVIRYRPAWPGNRCDLGRNRLLALEVIPEETDSWRCL